jgi:hypothetical protein
VWKLETTSLAAPVGPIRHPIEISHRLLALCLADKSRATAGPLQMLFVRFRLCPSRLSNVTRVPVFGVWSNGLDQAALTLFTCAGAAKGPLVPFPRQAWRLAL